MPNPHDPSPRVPSSRLPQTPFPDPRAGGGNVLLPAALAHAALHPLLFLMNQLWLGAAPLADLLGLPVGAVADSVPGALQRGRPLPPDSGSPAP